MKALVLGGTRFVGLRLVRELVRQGHQVTLLNRGKTQAQLPEGIQRLYADRRNPDAVRSALAGAQFDCVFDCTGYQAVSVEPVVQLFLGKVRRYVFISTTGVYAPSELMPVKEDFPLKSPETSDKGLAAYEIEKVQCENLLRRTHAEKGFPISIVRPSAIFGPENWMDDREGSYFARLLMGRKVLVPGNGATLMHLAYVDDVARLLITCAQNDAAVGQVYNAATPHAITIRAWIDTMARAAGVEAQKVFLSDAALAQVKGGLDHPAIFPFQYDSSLVYSIQKSRDELGFVPQYDWEEGLRQTFVWWRAERGLGKIEFAPGKLGHDVDLPYEDELIARYG